MHGKTTTSAMAAHVLREGGLHPSHYVGAEIPILGTNAHWDPRGEYFVAEGDESDGTIALFSSRARAGFEYRGGASRFLRRPRGDRGGLSLNCSSKPPARFFTAPTMRMRRGSVARSARRFPMGLPRRRIIAARMFELQDFASVFCVFRQRRKTGRSAS